MPNKSDHYSDVIMKYMATQITGNSFVGSTVCSGTDRSKHQTPRAANFTGDKESNKEDVSIWWRHHNKKV